MHYLFLSKIRLGSWHPGTHLWEPQRAKGIALEKVITGALTDTFKDKDYQELGVNVLLAQSSNFQHASPLKRSLKLKLHQLKAYEPLYRSSLTAKALAPKSNRFPPESLHMEAME